MIRDMTRQNMNFGVPEPPSTIACIEWIDASGEAGPLTRDELGGLMTLRSVGWLIRETDDQVSICMDYEPTTKVFREIQHIAKVNIVSRKEYRYASPA